MKKIFIQILFLLIISNSYAFSLSEALGKIEDQAKEKVKKDGAVSLDNLIDSIKKEANDKIVEIEEKVNGQIDSVSDKVKASIEDFENIKDKSEFYLLLFKIVSAIFSCSIILIIFFIFKLYRRLNRLLQLFENIKNYKDIEKRLTNLEKLAERNS